MLAITACKGVRQLRLLVAAAEGAWHHHDDGISSTSTSCPTQPASQHHVSNFMRGMATKKAGGTARQNPDTRSRNLGVKFAANEVVFPGHIIVRQRGTKWHAGHNVGLGKDHTIFATSVGVVKFTSREITYPSGRQKTSTVVHVVPVNGDWSPAYKELEEEMVARRAVFKRQLLKSRAFEAALHFPFPQPSQRTLPVVIPPPALAAARKSSAKPTAQR